MSSSSLFSGVCVTVSPSPSPLLYTSTKRFTLFSRHNLPTVPLTNSSSLHLQPFLKNTRTLFSPLTPQNPNSYPSLKCKSHLNSIPLISPHDHWGTWTILFVIAAFGIWSEKTKMGSMLSGAVVSTLAGLTASNLGIISFEAPAYSIVMEYLLPMAVPLLLFKADLRRVVKSTGTLLLAFLLGSVATMVGTLVAYLMVPMRSLGQDSWKIAAALMSSYIGGTVNLVQTVKAWPFFVCVSIVTVASVAFIWIKKQNSMEGKQVQNTDLVTPTMSPAGSLPNYPDQELESVPLQSLAECTKLTFGARPDLKNILLNCKESDVGVLVCGPRKMRHEVARICSSGLVENLHFEAMSFNW